MSDRDRYMALLQICTTPLGPGLPSPATLLFNGQVRSIMPVLDHKPIKHDCDDKHHNRLVARQDKNSNDNATILSHIPLGSTTAVQREDGRLWTHGMVVNTSNQNHHDRSYIVQLTTTGQWITRNRCHIKPTSITVNSYIQHHTNRHHIRTTDPLQEILDNINKNPELFSNKHVQNTPLTNNNYT